MLGDGKRQKKIGGVRIINTRVKQLRGGKFTLISFLRLHSKYVGFMFDVEKICEKVISN